MRRIMTSLLVLVTVLVPLSVIAQEDQPVTLRVVGFEVQAEEKDTPLAKGYQAFLDQFRADHPNVTLESLETPPEFDTQLLVDLAAGTAPDVWSQDGSTIARVIDTGSILDMRKCVEVVPELNLDRFFPTVLAIHEREDGSIYGLPNDFTPMVIYYNPEAFERAGVEPPQDGWTWDDLLDLSQRLTLDSEGRNRLDPDFDESNVVQWGFRVRQYVFEWIYRVWENGGDVISPDGTTVSGYLDSPESIEAIKFLRDLALEYGVSPDPTLYSQMTQETSMVTLYLQGQFAMFDRGHWELVGIRANPDYKPERVAVIGQPMRKERATVLYESSFVINAAVESDPAKLLAACQFVEAATDRGYQDTKNLTGIAISANQAAAEEAAQNTEYPEIEQVFINEVQYGRPPYGSRFANWPTVESLLDSMMERILAGGDVETEVAAAVEEINRELERASQ